MNRIVRGFVSGNLLFAVASFLMVQLVDANNQVLHAQVPYSTAQGGGQLYATADGFKVQFNRNFLGAMIDGSYKGTSIGNEWPGSGLCTWHWNSGGQDPTATSPDGPNPVPISTPDRPWPGAMAEQTDFRYIDAIGTLRVRVEGFAPYFVIDHSVLDHALASPTSGLWFGGWNVEAMKTDPAVPIEFRPNGAQSGAWFVGNEKRIPNATDRNLQALARFRGGRVCAVSHVQLPAGDQAAYAGILFRKNIASANAPTLDDAFGGSGHLFAVNGLGNWGLTGGNVTASGTLSAAAKTKIMNGTGVSLTVKGSATEPNKFTLLVDNQKVHEFTSPSTGEHVGLLAYSSGGKVRFGYRSFYDLSTKFVMQYDVSPKGYVDVRAESRMNGVSYRRQAYFSAVLGSFLDRQTINPRSVWAYQTNGVRNNSVDGLILDTNAYKAFFAGNASGSRGVFIENVRSSHAGSHALLQTVATNAEHILHVNALPSSAFNGQYVLANTVWLSYRMWPRVPPGYN